jgi:cobyric acid synthase
LIILPGSKNTLAILSGSWRPRSPNAYWNTTVGVPVMGICGGYQMLGESLTDEVESGLGRMALTDHTFCTRENDRMVVSQSPGCWVAFLKGTGLRDPYG